MMYQHGEDVRDTCLVLEAVQGFYIRTYIRTRKRRDGFFILGNLVGVFLMTLHKRVVMAFFLFHFIFARNFEAKLLVPKFVEKS